MQDLRTKKNETLDFRQTFTLAFLVAPQKISYAVTFYFGRNTAAKHSVLSK
jgi:hypothetical protein